jgi:hypothetical protein
VQAVVVLALVVIAAADPVLSATATATPAPANSAKTAKCDKLGGIGIVGSTSVLGAVD